MLKLAGEAIMQEFQESIDADQNFGGAGFLDSLRSHHHIISSSLQE